jgi:hypothetical protein
MRKTSLTVILTCVLTCTVLIGSAMNIPPRPPKPPKPPKGGHHNAPFDGGISLLLVAGAAYGIKKAYNRKLENAL